MSQTQNLSISKEGNEMFLKICIIILATIFVVVGVDRISSSLEVGTSGDVLKASIHFVWGLVALGVGFFLPTIIRK